MPVLRRSQVGDYTMHATLGLAGGKPVLTLERNRFSKRVVIDVELTEEQRKKIDLVMGVF